MKYIKKTDGLIPKIIFKDESIVVLRQLSQGNEFRNITVSAKSFSQDYRVVG